MWKIALGFVVFAAVALFILSRGGDIDMGGEKHGTDSAPAHPEVAASAAPASAASAPASSAKP
nr:hypothetical protein [Rhodoferax sp.]